MHTILLVETMKEFTIIWVDSWMSGSHMHQLIRKTFIKANSVEDVMKSDYGDSSQYIFEGFIPTIGEVIEENLIVIID